MDIILIALWSLLLCFLTALIIYTFPSSFERDSMTNGTRKIQRIFLIICLIIVIVAILLSKLLKIALLFIEYKIALMLIPIFSCIVFCALVYYPSVRLLVKINTADQTDIDRLVSIMFRCIYSDSAAEKEKSLDILAGFCGKHEQLLKQYRLYLYLVEYQKLITPVTFKAPESMINCVLSKCDQVKHDIDSFTPIPFPNIGLVLSFAFSTILTILLSIISLAS